MTFKRLIFVLACVAAIASPHAVFAQAARPLGTVKAIADSVITLTTDSGAQLKIIVQQNTRIVRAAPGQKDLKEASPITLPEIHAGDRMLVRGTTAADGSVVASSVVVMRRADIAEKQERDRADWQKRGVAGLVTAVDANTGTLTLSTGGFAARTITVRTSKTTIVRRYVPDSVKFDHAVRATLDAIKVGDQLRARGNRSPDGVTLDAEELVAGSFRNIAGTVISVDAAANTLTAMDLATKKPVTVRVAADSQLRALPQMFAQRIAARLKGASGEPGREAAVEAHRPPPGNGRGGDFQQMLERMPAVALADMHKDDAIMMVATQGSPAGGPIIITLLTGVEPILTASPTGNRAAMLLSPWNLGASTGDAE